jgi:hypothetical protein
VSVLAVLLVSVVVFSLLREGELRFGEQQACPRTDRFDKLTQVHGGQIFGWICVSTLFVALQIVGCVVSPEVVSGVGTRGCFW